VFGKITKAIIEWIESFITSIVVLFTIYVLIAFPVVVEGESMYPTLHTKDQLLIEKVTPLFSGYVRGDILVVHPPNMDYINYIKRIVALPGEKVKIHNCQVIIRTADGEFSLDESAYLDKNVCTTGGRVLRDGWEYSLADDEYMVLGDNRNNSQDSRNLGFIKKNRIQGKLVSLFWPFDRAKLY